MKIILFFLIIFILLVACANDQISKQDTAEQATSDMESSDISVTSCPPCEDHNVCTEDLCSADTGYKCQYQELKPCCGNGICEENETNCAEDCPACTATKCHNASFDYATQKCITTEIIPCCGNGICEENETNCAEDCPVCSSEKRCFKGVFDYQAQRCVEKPIIPCCGNSICDRGESCDSCEDCECEKGIDLSGFPGFLDKNPLIVVGENGKSRDVLTATSLSTTLYVEGVEARADIYTEFASSDLSSSDLIVIGSPCDNSLWEEYQGVGCDKDYFDKDSALIKLIQDNGREIVYVGGYGSTDNQKAVEYLSSHPLSGTEIELDTSGTSARKK